MNAWKNTEDELPEIGRRVLIVLFGRVRIGALYRSVEEGMEVLYWDDPHDEGCCWDWGDVWYWMDLPKMPEECL